MTEIKDAGIIVLNKEAGISSNTAVNRVKHLVNAQKAGHLGTLDVLGEGVLPITLNKATRLFDYYLTKDKTYRAIFVFGFQTVYVV
jgi:tRNA pseudouridine55 synthase